jgi:hypothetical protein
MNSWDKNDVKKNEIKSVEVRNNIKIRSKMDSWEYCGCNKKVSTMLVL